MSDSEKRPLFQNPPPGMSKSGELASKEDLLLIIKEKEKKITLAQGLPFLYGWQWYPWARKFFESTNPINLLCAANQISKSSTQIRKCIHWATNKAIWPELWSNTPQQFWYLYPTQKQVNAEFETKWKQFLPRNGFENDAEYGYEIERDSKKNVIAVHFNSGVHLYFKTYAQNVTALQSGTVDALFCDEELPIDLLDELLFRLSASGGYFHMVFTATLGQEEWRKAMEPKDNEEYLPTAFKQTVSLYDAMFYEDGTASHWTAEKIAAVRAKCSTQQEIDKRVYGRFVVLGGRKCEAFDITRHMVKSHPIPASWYKYGGVDPGSGGETGHPAAIVFVAVRPDFRAGRVFCGWRGDGIDTTSGDVAEKYVEMKRANNIKTTAQYYDWADKDFFTIASRMGQSFEMAEKGHVVGEEILNTLFKNDMLFIYEDPELGKLGGEISSLLRSTPKEKAKDDFYDALRYAVTKIPWDWSVINDELSDVIPEPEIEMTPNQREVFERRQQFMKGSDEKRSEIDDEIDEWNEAYGE